MNNLKKFLIKPIYSITMVATMMGCSHTDGKKENPPNILLILADDMGYSDLGCFGGEIKTPNIDALSENGVRFTNFYSAARCCPTRASLLTGVYPHQAGMGGMVRHTDDPKRSEGAYQGYLSRNTVTIAEVLKKKGYYTTMSGKWHVGEEKKDWPMNRGFDNYYGLISGASHYFDVKKMIRPGIDRHFAKGMEEHNPTDTNFYMTDAISNHAVETIRKREKDNKPFFMYVAYTAPHWPLHALPEDIEKYKNTYDIGWDSLRIRRYKKMKRLGIADKSMNLAPRDPKIPQWSKVKKKKRLSRKMAVYAAQIDRMDQGIGKIIKELKRTGEYDNTLIIFLSDNGACAETGLLGNDWWANNAVPGGADSYQSYGRAWANMCNTPFKYYKQWAYEGGIATPLIVSGNKFVKNRGSISRQQGIVNDILPTLLDLTDSEYPESYNGNSIIPVEGKSILPSLKGKISEGHEYLYWEHIGNMAVIHKNWKLVSRRREGDKSWQLYDISTDRAEQNNIVSENKDIASKLLNKYIDWADKMKINHTVEKRFSDEN